MVVFHSCVLYFFFNDTATTEIYTLSLHDALPISATDCATASTRRRNRRACSASPWSATHTPRRFRLTKRKRSEEHTSELQSRSDLVCRLLLEKKTKGSSLLS